MGINRLTLISSINLRKKYFLIPLIIALYLSSLLPPPFELSINGYKSLLIVFFALVLWITEILPPALTSILILILLPVMGVIPFEESIAGFSDSSCILLVSIFILSIAMSNSGLDQRIALSLLRLAKGKIRLTIFMAIFTAMIMTFLIPTSAGRTALMVPICLGMVKAMHLKPGSNIAKSIFLSLSFVSIIFSNAVITGAPSIIYAASLFQKAAGYKWNYITWLVYMLPGAALISFLILPVLLWIFPPEKEEMKSALTYIDERLKTMGPLSVAEKKVASLFAFMILLWITTNTHHLPVALTALIIAALTFFPGLELHSWKEAMAKVEWGTVAIFASSLAMAASLKSTGVINWFAQIALVFVMGDNSYLAGLTIIIVAVVIRLGFNNVLGAMAVTLPLTFEIASALHMNPVWLGLLSVVGTDLCFFLPIQSPSLLVSYATGYYTMFDTLKAGTATVIMAIIITLIMATFYWPVLGINLLQVISMAGSG
ncbi:Sodium/sulphate symporter [Moorella glycerini]|uniref:Sodium-dependent dicarboxylate transporter SdcS n=1 Tax=Neomoorella stamsii TaxID=1266720 RepID=A0A9X7J5G5_9FIRM|nr:MULTISPECIES: DASS family sodium-coupled anion symporter [Moorella]PRR76412.1 Sodium-dependent dicarboxylate transporter SdcS [Moorella stamsii]CEP67019.1 Sodium/sulphate symporter [Moorella glycerini]